MTRQKILLALAFGLLFFSANLFATNPEGRFRLKEGDWFEVHISPFNYNGFYSDNWWIRYQLKRQLPNSNQQYSVTVERYKIKKDVLLGWIGYDSYYPPFQDPKNAPTIKPQFTMEVSPLGKVLKFENLQKFDSIIPLTQINQELNLASISLNDTIKKNTLKKYSEIVMWNPQSTEINAFFRTIVDIKEKHLQEKKDFTITTTKCSDGNSLATWHAKPTGVPCLIKYKGIPCVHITNASFSIPANTILSGKLQWVTTDSVAVLSPGYPFLESDKTQKNYRVKVKKDGSFSCSIFLSEAAPFYIGELYTFLEPFDTLNVIEVTNPFKLQYRFSGNAAQNAELASQMLYFLYIDNFKNIKNLLDFHEKNSKALKKLLKMFEGKASQTCLDYYQTEWIYRLAWDKLHFFQDQNFLNPLRNSSINKTYPANFFREVDTIPVLLNNFQSGFYYNEFIELLLSFKMFRNNYQFGGIPTNFNTNYYLSLAMLKGYPLYKHTAKILETMLREGYESTKQVDYCYQTFINNCADSAITKPLIELYKNALRYAPGQLFPLQIFQKKSNFDPDTSKWEENNMQGVKNNHIDSLINMPLTRFGNTFQVQPNLLKNIQTFDFENGFPLNQISMGTCIDPAVSDLTTDTRKNLSSETFSLPTLYLKNGSLLDLKKFKGKAICLIFEPHHYVFSFMDILGKEIRTFKPSEVEFIIVSDIGRKLDNTIINCSNVTIAELSEVQMHLNPGRIIVLDRWLRIVNDNVAHPISKENSTKFSEAIQNAINATYFTTKQKTIFYQVAAWCISLVLLSSLFGWLIYRVRIRQLEHQEAIKRQIKELEIKAIRSQMNPHFIFNALNSIQSLVNSNQYKEANIYLAKFSVLLRGVLNNSEQSLVTLSDELEAVRLYCELEQLRFEFELTLDVSPEIDPTLIEIPGMIIQPLAENAIVHGLSPLGSKGKLTIAISRCNGSLCVCVSDNGVGLPQQHDDKLRQKGFGLKLVEERIAILSHSGKQAKLTVENKGKDAGTMATLVIPVE
jgi:two-component sensor histidine kinase